MPRVLVADDDQPVRAVIAMACQLEGHEADESYDAPTTVAAYERCPPDLLVLDLKMPGGGGGAVLEILRARHPEGLCPVLLVSGYVDELSDRALAELEVQGKLQKPVSVALLRHEISRLLDASGGLPGA